LADSEIGGGKERRGWLLVTAATQPPKFKKGGVTIEGNVTYRGNPVPEALVKAAEVLTTLDFYQDAIAMFSKVLEVYPDAEPAAYAQTCIGWLYGGMGDTEKAKAELEKVATNYRQPLC
jgi:tetratricopeptide (TPR) repeat protein